MADTAKVLGVLGGMGPLASAHFMTRLTLLTPALRDQDHIPAILWSDPRIPDRTRTHIPGAEDPLPWLLRGVAGLRRAGVGAIVIPCNTAHGWYEPICDAAAAIPVLHIVDAAQAELRRHAAAPGPVGIMATEAALAMRLYQDGLEAQGWRCVVPSPETMAVRVTPAIEMIKVNRLSEAYTLLSLCVDELVEQGVAAIILACTEIPVALKAGPRPAVPIFDTTDALAKSAVAWWQGAAQP
jgi:aspartate racemase